MKTYIWLTCSFPGFHYWKNAPDSCEFLRHHHRHIFHVKMKFPVKHNDRDIEFITKKKEIQQFIDGNYKNLVFPYSCEMLAVDLGETFRACFVSVSEDNENGAEVHFDEYE